MDGPGLGIDPRDLARIALVYAEGLVAAVEYHRVAGFVVGCPGHLCVGQPARDEFACLPRRPMHRAFGDQSLADRLVDGVAQRPGRGDHGPPVSRCSGESESQRLAASWPRLSGSACATRSPSLANAVFTSPARLAPDRLFQLRIALAEDLVHRRRGHAGPLQLRERLAGLHPVELLLVPHQDDPGQAQRGGRSEAGPSSARWRRAEASSTTNIVFAWVLRISRRLRAVPRPSANPAWRARKRCRVSLRMPDSCPSVRAAEADGASPATR